MNIPLDLKWKLICESVEANRQFVDGEGRTVHTLANNVSNFNAARILDGQAAC